MAEINNPNKNNSSSKKMIKKSTKVDLTPMVDLGFLLITFFVFTTTMARATAMQMFEPKEGEPKLVPATGAMTILLGKENKLCYYFGDLDTVQNKTAFVQSDFKKIRKIIADKKQTTPVSKLMYIIKSSDEAKFGNAMAVIDEMTICGVKPGHYAEDKISFAEEKSIH
jgi:biopolymer transport protein ExbD